MGRSGLKRLSRKGSSNQGGTCSAGGEGGVTVDGGGGGVGSLHSGVSGMEMYVDSLMTMGVGEELSAMSEGSGWMICVVTPSFYPARDGIYGSLRSIGGRICFDGVLRVPFPFHKVLEIMASFKMVVIDDGLDFKFFFSINDVWGRSQEVVPVLMGLFEYGQETCMEDVMDGPGQR